MQKLVRQIPSCNLIMQPTFVEDCRSQSVERASATLCARKLKSVQEEADQRMTYRNVPSVVHNRGAIFIGLVSSACLHLAPRRWAGCGRRASVLRGPRRVRCAYLDRHKTPPPRAHRWAHVTRAMATRLEKGARTRNLCGTLAEVSQHPGIRKPARR